MKLLSFFVLSFWLLKADPFPEGDGINTDVVIIYKDNKIIYEKYARNYSKESIHFSWSMAKTITGILIGIAESEGLLSFNEKPSFLKKTHPETTILDLLQMSSGIKFFEEYSNLPVNIDVVKMLYLDGAKTGVAEYANSLPERGEKPGSYFYYSSGDTNILMKILKDKMSQSEYENYPWTRLFNKLDIKATIERDLQGTFIGSSYMYMKPYDFLKLGILVMNKGVYNGEQIIPKKYIEMMGKVGFGVENKCLKKSSWQRGYGLQVFLNKPVGPRYPRPTFKDIPSDSLLFKGHQGQMIVVSPKEKLVILRLATDKEGKFKSENFFSLVKGFIKEKIDYKSAEDEFDYSINYPEPEIDSLPPKKNILDYFEIPKLATNLMSKEFCSCYFVMGRSKDQCRQDLEAIFPIIPFIDIDESHKSVKAYFLPYTGSYAKYDGERFGCILNIK